MRAVSTAAGRARAGRRRIDPRRAAGRSSFYLLVTIFVVVSLFPFYWIVFTALKTQGEISAGTTSLLPGCITWGNFSTVLTHGTSVRSLLNTLLVAAAPPFLTLILPSLPPPA